MKLFVATLLFALSAHASDFLLFTIDRYAYEGAAPGRNQENKQSFKVELSPTWSAQFKQLPDQNHSGTDFICQTWDNYSGEGWSGLVFTTTFHPNLDHTLTATGSVAGAETIDGQQQFRAPEGATTTAMTLASIAQVNFTTSTGFSNAQMSGVNASVSVKRVAVNDPALAHALTAEIMPSGQTFKTPPLVVGEPVPPAVKFKMNCLFQDD